MGGLGHILDENSQVLLTGWLWQRGKVNYLSSTTKINNMEGEKVNQKLNFGCTKCKMVIRSGKIVG